MSYREFEKSKTIFGENARKQWGIHQQLKKDVIRFDRNMEKQRKTWDFKPSKMIVILTHTAGAFLAGLTLSVPHEVGRMLLHRRLAAILERDLVAVDAVITGTLEEAVEIMGLGETK